MRDHEQSFKGGHFFPIAIFGSLMALGYFDHPPLLYYHPQLDALWHPVFVSVLFAACYATFLLYRSWYARHPLPIGRRSVHEFREWNTLRFWVLLGVGMYALVLAGTLNGLVVCAAGLAVTAWLIAYRQIMGTLWRIYDFFLWPLVPSCVVPPLLGWPTPNILATLFLGSLGLTMAGISAIDHYHYVRLLKRVEEPA